MDELLKTIDTMVPKNVHEAEVGRLKKQIDDAHAEIDSLNKRLEGCVSNDLLAAAKSQTDALTAQVGALTQKLQAMVPRDQHDAPQALLGAANHDLIDLRQETLGLMSTVQSCLHVYRGEIDAIGGEVVRMQSVVLSMVPAVQLAIIRDQLKQASREIQRLRKSLDSSVAASLLGEARAENQRLAGEIIRIRQRLQGMVPKGNAEQCKAEMDGLAAEVKRLQQELASAGEKEQALQGQQDELAQVRADVQTVLRLQGSLRASVPKAQYDAAQDNSEAASRQKEIEKLNQLLISMVSRSALTESMMQRKRSKDC
jgi:predicted translin family RNA/ssDNA-binding protein